ncbi:hypothetical protein [Flavobacterium geliluteum]|uniref:Uncharacterized protein n=1 Tax=Flavobacterium geliluteum TaxID=2816120 RepID=A0A940XHS2_9FLAO|nr:hypothetical protein [Flavobacterium geliluteum]MBP4140045.1 hypothetical protein [Flavobacterium geliluteum]
MEELQYNQFIINKTCVTEIRNNIFEKFNIFEIMNDRYQDIIDQEKVKLNLKLAKINRSHKRTMFTIYATFLIALICLICFFTPVLD